MKSHFVGSSIEAPSSSTDPVFGRSMISTGASSLAERSTTQAGAGDPQCGQSMCMSASPPVALLSTCSGTLPLGASSLVARSMRDPGSSSSALRSKSMCSAGGLLFGHGLGSFSSSSLAVKSTSRRSAGSSDPLCGRDPGTCSSALKGKVWKRRQSLEFEDCFVPCTSPSQRVHLFNSFVRPSSSQDTHDRHRDMNSCRSVHGGGVHVNSSGMHLNSGDAVGHRNSCNLHAAGVLGGTKASSMSTRIGVRCPAVEKLASPQQAPESLHGEVWNSILQNQGPKIFREVEIVPGCAVTVACPSCPDHSPEPPGPCRIIRNMLGWSLEEKNVGSGVWLFRGALQWKIFSSLDAIGDWVRKGSYHTAWAVPCDSLCTFSYSYGRGPARGPHTGQLCWPLLEGVWRAIAPLKKPWCAEEEVPTAANLNLYRGWNSCVGWHCDDEPLFGEYGDDKLIVSVSLGSSAVFRWRRRSCPDDEGHLCCLGHGDILVMDGRSQDKFLHRTDPCRDSNGSTLRSVGSNNMFPPVLCLGQEKHVVCQCVRRVYPFPLWRIPGMAFLGLFGLLFCVMCAREEEGGAGFAGLLFAHKTWVTLVCLLLGTSFPRCLAGALPL